MGFLEVIYIFFDSFVKEIIINIIIKYHFLIAQITTKNSNELLGGFRKLFLLYSFFNNTFPISFQPSNHQSKY